MSIIRDLIQRIKIKKSKRDKIVIYPLIPIMVNPNTKIEKISHYLSLSSLKENMITNLA